MPAVNLKILEVVHTVLVCESTTKAGEVLNLTPSAVTYWLNKAREVTGSALFFRKHNRMVPDSIARELSEMYQKFTSNFKEDDKKLNLDNRSLTVSTYALLECMLAMAFNHPGLDKKVTFLPLPLNSDERLCRLRNKEVDLDLGFALPADRSIIRTCALSSPLKAVVRKNHPTIADSLTLKDWTENRHICWSRESQVSSGMESSVGQYYELLHRRRLSCISSNSASLLMMACYTNDIVLVPEFIARYFLSNLPIVIHDLPISFPMFCEFHAHYHCSMSKNAEIDKMLHQIRELLICSPL